MVLQVASELGIGGLLIFVFLVAARRLCAGADAAAAACGAAPAAGAAPGSDAAGRAARSAPSTSCSAMHAAALSAALAGWFVCALFASVAYHWTFYYLLALAVAPRDYLLGAGGGRPCRAGAPPPARTVAAVGAHA